MKNAPNFQATFYSVAIDIAYSKSNVFTAEEKKTRNEEVNSL